MYVQVIVTGFGELIPSSRVSEVEQGMAREVALVIEMLCMVAMMVATMVVTMVAVVMVMVGLAPILVLVTQTSDTVPALETLEYSPARYTGDLKILSTKDILELGGALYYSHNTCNIILYFQPECDLVNPGGRGEEGNAPGSKQGGFRRWHLRRALGSKMKKTDWI